MQLQETQTNKTSLQPAFTDKITSSPIAKQVSAKMPDVSLATALGVVSLILGVSEVVRTRNVSQKAGLNKKYAPIVRAFGVREITSGVGLLVSENKKPWLWSRVIGDVLDSAFLGYAYYNERTPDMRKKLVKAFVTISPIVAADIYAVVREG